MLERSFHSGRQHSPSTVKPLPMTTAPATAVDAGTTGGSLSKAAMADAVSPASALPLPSSCLPPRRSHTVQLAAVGAAGSHPVAVLTGGSLGAAGNGSSGSGPHSSGLCSSCKLVGVVPDSSHESHCADWTPHAGMLFSVPGNRRRPLPHSANAPPGSFSLSHHRPLSAISHSLICSR